MNYKVKWIQGVMQDEQYVQIPNKIETFDTIYQTNPLNSNWGSAGCYAGARGQNSSLIGGYSVVNWPDWKLDRAQSDMRDFEVVSSTNSSQQNLRFLVRYTNGNFATPRQAFNWTGLRSTTVQSIQTCYDNLQQVGTSVNIYDPYYRQTKDVSTNGVLNTPLNIAPLTELKINNLIWLPYFTIREIEFYGYNAELGCYTTKDSVEGEEVFTWGQIKNQDKLPAGVNYDEELFTKGFKTITPRHEDGIRFQYVAGCVLVPFYGECSCVYDQVNDAYVQSTNPVDHQVYDSRGILGSIANDTDEFPQFNNVTNMNNCNLIVLSEFTSSVTGGTVYATPPGICFANYAQDHTTLSGSSYSITPTWNFSVNFQIFNSVSGWTTFWNANYDQPFFYEDQDPSATNQNSPSLFAPCTKQDIKGDFATKYASIPNQVRYFIDASNGGIYSLAKGSNRTVSVTYLSYFSIQELWATIASLGCYVALNYSTAQNAPTGKYCGNNNNLYLGYMDSSGVTNGTMLQGIDIVDSAQSEIDDIIQNTPYKPVVPGEGDKEEDPSNIPSASGKGEPKLVGDLTTGQKIRETGAGSVTYYGLNIAESKLFNDALWAQASSFYDAIQIAGRQNTSIFDYISSFRYYPSSLSTMGFETGNAQPLYLGTGAKFKNVNTGVDFLLNPMSDFLGDFEWCNWDLSTFTGWRQNFLDYAPYLKLSIYLPYAGTFDLDPQTVAAMSSINNAVITVRVSIDLNTGCLTYYVDSDGILILERTVKFGIDLPLAGNDVVQQSAAIIRATTSNAKEIVGEASTIGAEIGSGSIIGLISTILNLPANLINKGVDSALANRQVPTQVGSFGGAMSNVTEGQDPYITIYRQKIANPENYGHTVGYLTQSTHQIGKLSGFTICNNPDLSGIAGTEEEVKELNTILTTGFFV